MGTLGALFEMPLTQPRRGRVSSRDETHPKSGELTCLNRSGREADEGTDSGDKTSTKYTVIVQSKFQIYFNSLLAITNAAISCIEAACKISKIRDLGPPRRHQPVPQLDRDKRIDLAAAAYPKGCRGLVAFTRLRS